MRVKKCNIVDESAQEDENQSAINTDEVFFPQKLLQKLHPRHISVETVVYTHKSKIGGRCLYYFRSASGNALSKPVFTIKEKLDYMLHTPTIPDEAHDDLPQSPKLGRSSNLRRGDESSLAGVCILKRIHLEDPNFDIGVNVWKENRPQLGMNMNVLSIHSGKGPALLVEYFNSNSMDGMAVAASFIGEAMFLIPLSDASNSHQEFKPRRTIIDVEESVLSCICESISWFIVKSYARKRISTEHRFADNVNGGAIGRRNFTLGLRVNSA